MKRARAPVRWGVAWLELLLALAVAALVVQLLLAAPPGAWARLDVRNWSSWGWFALFALCCAGLCTIQYGPAGVRQLRAWRAERQLERARKQQQQELAQKKANQAEERAVYERMREARRRRTF
jgi:hypothetical protein